MFLEKEIKVNQTVLSKKDILQFLPTSLEKVINGREIVTYKEKRLKTNFLVDIVHNLILKYYNTLKNGVGDSEFNLSSTILREKYGAGYNYYLNFLIETGILRLSSNYLVGKKTKTYGLTEFTLKSEVKRFRNTDKRLVKKWRENILGIQTKENISNYIQPEIKNKLVADLFSISIDMDLSKAYLERYKEDNDVYQKNMFSVESINEGNIFFNFDDYGRMHSNFTILKSIIRKKCLSIDGSGVFEKDLSNSQPLFLYKLINDEFQQLVDKEELSFFFNLVKTGEYYKYLTSSLNLKNKSEAKELTYKVLFGTNHFNSKYDKCFLNLFPSIYGFIKYYKSKCDSYKCLSHTLQRMESNLIFNKIVKELYLIYPNIKIFTIHDSIICSYEYRDAVEEVFNKKICEEFFI